MSERAQRIVLAVGVAQPGSYAKVYGPDNGTLGFHDIPKAVIMAEAGLAGVAAYTVLPSADVGPCVDIDLPRELDRLIQAVLKDAAASRGRRAALNGDELAAALRGLDPFVWMQRWMINQLRGMYEQVTRAWGARAAILPSGRGAHLLPVGLDPAGRQQLLNHITQLQAELRDRLAAVGLPPTEAAFEIKSYCRPPASPHRFEGDLGILLYPLPGIDQSLQQELLEFLAERGQQRLEQGLTAPRFPDRLNELLQGGRLVGRRRDVFLHVAIRADLQFEHALQVVNQEGSGTYRSSARPVERLAMWRRRLEIRWNRARTAVERIGQALAPIRAAVKAYDWRYRTGMTDKRVLEGYLSIAEEEASLVISPGDRRVAEEADCSSVTVGRSNERLRDCGWLQLLHRVKGLSREASRWKLRLPRQSHSKALPVDPKLLGGEIASSVSCNHDVWLVLPSDAPEVYESLTNVPSTAAGVAQALKLGLRRVQRIFQALEGADLAVQHGGGRGRVPAKWMRGPATLDDAVAKLGVTNARAARREKRRALHTAERQRHQEAMLPPQPRMPIVS